MNLIVCLFVCGVSLTPGQLVNELFPDCGELKEPTKEQLEKVSRKKETELEIKELKAQIGWKHGGQSIFFYLRNIIHVCS